MKIFEGVDAIRLLSGQGSLLDSKLLSIKITDDDFVRVELEFSMSPRALCKSVTLLFSDVREFEFNHSSEFVFGNVENVKFQRTQEANYYLSLDPDPKNSGPSIDDNDYVVATSVSAVTTL